MISSASAAKYHEAEMLRDYTRQGGRHWPMIAHVNRDMAKMYIAV